MSWRLLPVCLAAWIAAGYPAACGGEAVIPCRADTSICCHKKERRINAGGDERVKVKGIENFLLLDFDATAIRGKTVRSAVLHVRNAREKPMLRLVGVSTVATPWREGGGREHAEAGEGESCFESPELGRRTWAGPGSSFLEAVFGLGGTFWKQVYVGDPVEGWFRIPVDARIVEAMAQGISRGMCVSCDNGEVKRIHKDVWPGVIKGNNYVASRESDTPPYLRVVYDQAPDRVAPGAVRNLAVRPSPASAKHGLGAALISWTASGDDGEEGRALGYVVKVGQEGAEATELERWRTPAPPPAGQRVELLLEGLRPNARLAVEVIALDEGGNRTRSACTGKASAGRTPPRRLEPVRARVAKGREPDSRGRMRVWAFGDLLRVNPVSGNLLEERGVEYGGERGGTYRQANEVWNGAESTVSVAAARGEWVAFQLCVEAAEGRLKEARAHLLPFSGPDGREMAHVLRHSGISRAWYVRRDGNWYADPLVPLEGPFAVPWKRNAVPGQRNQTLYVEMFVPLAMAPGVYVGGVELSARGVERFVLPLRLEVRPFTVSAETHFVWSMNTYTSPGRSWGGPAVPVFLEAERDFYVKAHLHRTCLAALHYSHRGIVRHEAAPPLEGKGAATRVADWSAFDRRFGALFDGSAFRGTWREKIPMDHFYLALHENWPSPMAGGYRWNVDKWELHWKVAGPIEEGFTADYVGRWKAVLADHARHIREKGWKGTTFHVYLNNKYYYKMYGRTGPRRGAGTSFWCLDEPTHPRDFQALRYFSRLIREALGGRSGSIAFRADISRPESQRDILDGAVDLNICGDFHNYGRLVEERRRRFGETVWTYGGMPPISESALQLAVVAPAMYCRTIDGYVPWQTVGREDAWRKPEDTAAFYPGKPLGIVGCVPSLRLKACRRGQQDVEYVWLLGRKLGLDRRGTAELGAAALLAATGTKTLQPPAGSKHSEFPDLDYGALETFRRTLARALE
jgi:hypothetical protein